MTAQTDKSSRLTIAALLWSAARLGNLRGNATALWSTRLQREFQGTLRRQATTHFDGLRLALAKARGSEPAVMQVLSVLDFLIVPSWPAANLSWSAC